MKLQIGKLDLVTANEAYALTIPRGTRRFRMHTTDGTAWMVGLTKEAIGEGRYWTIYANGYWRETLPEPLKEDILIFAVCGSSNKVLEALFWIEERALPSLVDIPKEVKWR